MKTGKKPDLTYLGEKDHVEKTVSQKGRAFFRMISLVQ